MKLSIVQPLILSLTIALIMRQKTIESIKFPMEKKQLM